MCDNFTTGRKIDKEVVYGFLHAEKVGNKHFEAFLLDKLVENKISFFEPFYKARLITGNEKKKKFLKRFSVVKEFVKFLVYLLTKQ